MHHKPGSFHFHGGLHLEDHKAESLQQPLQTATLPNELILPLRQHIGEANQPLVKVGEAVKRGQRLAQTSEFVSAPIHAPTSGVISAIEPRLIAHPSGQPDICIVLQPDGKDTALENPLAEFANDLDDPQALLKLIRAAGIVGLGGAVFPSAAKLAKAQEYTIDTLIINGAECEPYITCDDILMQSEPQRIVAGIALLQKIVRPKQTLIGIEDNKPKAIKAMQQAVAESSLENAQVISIPTLYPSGGEKQLTKILTGIEVHSQQLAFDVGIFCQNVGTCAAIADAVEHQQPLLSRIVTVTGPGIRNPGNWVTPLGTPIRHLIELAGGYKVERPKLIMGGPMMGLNLASADIPVVKATNTILLLDHDEQPEVSECIRCGRCNDACPVNLLPQQLYWYSRSRQFERTEEYHLFDCIECGCCSAVCPSHLPLVQFYRFAKSEIRDQKLKAYKSDRARRRHEFRQARLEKLKQQAEERRRQKREALAKKKIQPPSKKSPDKASAGDAVQAALERVKARKQAQQATPKNTDNLTDQQQHQIDEAEARRNQMKKDETTKS
jgi:electron transport complex protein RnfC